MNTSTASTLSQHGDRRRPSLLLRVARAALALCGVLGLLALTFLGWALTPMQGERDAALAVWTDPSIHVTSTADAIILRPSDPTALPDPATRQGLLFLPGAKVDPYAYMRVLSGVVAESQATVVIAKPALNLAILDQRSFAELVREVPEVSDWSVGGHSLGGVRACQLVEQSAVDAAAATSSDVQATPRPTSLILFGSFCANDLSGSAIDVLSIGGSADGLSTPEKIDNAAGLLPQDATFASIPGLNHAGFGNYGKQQGDGVSSLSGDESRNAITAEIVAFWDQR